MAENEPEDDGSAGNGTAAERADAEVAVLAAQGALLRSIVVQPVSQWLPMLQRVAAGLWRPRVAPDGDDAVVFLEIEAEPGVWLPIGRVHRAQLGLPPIRAGAAEMLAAWSAPVPDDVSGLDGS